MILDSIDNCYNITKCLIARGYYLRAGMFKHSLVLLRALLECGYYLRECLIWGNTVFKGLHCVTFIKCPIHWIWISYLNFKAVLVLPKMAGSAQTHKSMSFIWIVWSTLYVYLWAEIELCCPINIHKFSLRPLIFSPWITADCAIKLLLLEFC